MMLDGTEPAILLMTRPEAARFLRVSVQTLNRLLARKELPSLKIGDRRLLRRVDLEAFVAARVVAGQN